MATKKQKRAEALAKHEKFMAELQRSNAAALRKDRERRSKPKAAAQQDKGVGTPTVELDESNYLTNPFSH